MKAGFGVLAAIAIAAATVGAQARGRGSNTGGGLPDLDVKTSCSDAQKFSSGGDKTNGAFKGCMQDEMAAKNDLGKRWSTFNGKDRQDCVEQSRTPSPSYVEVLTCLEMCTMRNAPKTAGRPTPQIGGPVAPGLTSPPTTPLPGPVPPADRPGQ